MYLNIHIFLIFKSILLFLLILFPLLLIVAILTLVERKVIGASQRRMGPNTQGIFGLLQPINDGIKLFFKETILPTNSNKIIFIFTPIIVFFTALLSWLIIPFKYGNVFADID